MVDEPKDSEIEDKPLGQGEDETKPPGTSEPDEEKPPGRGEDETKPPGTSKEEGEKPEDEADLKIRYTKQRQTYRPIEERAKEANFPDVASYVAALEQAETARRQPPATQPKTELDIAIERHKLAPDVIKDVSQAIRADVQRDQQAYQYEVRETQIQNTFDVHYAKFKDDNPDFPDDQRKGFEKEIRGLATMNPRLFNEGNVFQTMFHFKYATDPKNELMKKLVLAAEKRAEVRASKKEASKLTKLGKEKTPEDTKKDADTETVDEIFGGGDRGA